MKKIIKLTESDIEKIVKRVIKESGDDSDLEGEELANFIEADDYALELKDNLTEEIEFLVKDLLVNIDLENLIESYQYKFKERYPKYANTEIVNYYIDTLMGLKVKGGLDDIASMMTTSLMDEIYPE